MVLAFSTRGGLLGFSCVYVELLFLVFLRYFFACYLARGYF
jgi:hypothetical protein